ncbi:MAG: DUF3540 domain-containing protein [Myxococcota bacterium]
MTVPKLASQPASASVLRLPDGTEAARVDDAIELRDREGRLLVRFCDGTAEVVASHGNLTLAAPKGAVVLESGTDIELHAGRDVALRSRRGASIAVDESEVQVDGHGVRARAPRLEAEVAEGRLEAGVARVLAHRVERTSEEVIDRVEHYELTARRLVQRSAESLFEVTDLLQQRVGRLRQTVRGTFRLRTKRTRMTSEKQTQIDGEKVFLG